MRRDHLIDRAFGVDQTDRRNDHRQKIDPEQRRKELKIPLKTGLIRDPEDEELDG